MRSADRHTIRAALRVLDDPDTPDRTARATAAGLLELIVAGDDLRRTAQTQCLAGVREAEARHRRLAAEARRDAPG